MSCRAFSRRIEHQCLKQLFETFGVDEIDLAYQSTARNAPLREFLHSLMGQEPAAGHIRVTKPIFLKNVPPLFHRVSLKEPVHV
jgi:predicted enzyme involved in methoxymalonyl-ACP biosynthesis